MSTNKTLKPQPSVERVPPPPVGPAPPLPPPPPRHTKPASTAGAIPIRYSPVVEDALEALCPSTDPLDSPDFDLMAYVNAKLSSPEALAAIEDSVTELHGRLERTERDISQSIRSDALSSRDTQKELGRARESVMALFNQVAEIKSKAEASEVMVRTILRDIDQLDCAKRNLTASLTTVTDLKKIACGLFNLQVAIDSKQYDEASTFVTYAKCTMTSFEPFEKIPKVRELNSKLQLLCRQLENKLKHDFVVNVRPGKTSTQLQPPSPRLHELCVVATALGPDTVHKIQRHFVLEQLEDYRQAFRPGTEDAVLVRTERRYAWLRRFLRFYSDYLRYIFPDEWYVPHELSAEFCLITRDVLEAQLQIEASTVDVAILHRCVEKTMDFEKELTLRARTVWMTDVDADEEDDDGGDTEESQARANRSADAVRKKWAARMKQRAAPSGETAGAEKQYNFISSITPCFENHLVRYVQHVEGEMMTNVDSFVGEKEQWHPAEDPSDPEGFIGTTLVCANDVFAFIKESLRHVNVISRGTTFVQMADVWQRGLKYFASKLQVNLPKDARDESQFRRICLIMNTSQFCSGTTPSLSEEVLSRLDEAFQDKINFEEAIDAFTLVTTNSMGAYIGGLEKKMQPSFSEFRQTNWSVYATGDMTVDESRYMGLIRKTMVEGVVMASKILDPTLLRMMCVKLAKSFLTQYLGTVYKLKKVNTEATHQLRVDVGALDRLFSGLPNSGNPTRFDAKTLTTYHRTVSREIARATAVLQILSIDAPAQIVEMYLELVHEDDRSVTDFGRIVNLKGFPRPEWMALVEVMRRKNVRETTDRDTQQATGNLKGDEEKDFADTVKTEMKARFAGINMGTFKDGFTGLFKDDKDKDKDKQKT